MASRTQTVRGSRSSNQRGGGRGKRNSWNDSHEYFGRENTDENNSDKRHLFDNDLRRRGNSRGSLRGNRPRGNMLGGSVENTRKENLSSPSIISNTKKLPDHSQNPIFRNHLMARFSKFLPPSNTVETETVQNPPINQPDNESSEDFVYNQNVLSQNNSFGSNFHPEQYGSNQQKQSLPNDSSKLKKVNKNNPKNHRQKFPYKGTSDFIDVPNTIDEHVGNQPFQNTLGREETFKDIDEKIKTSASVNDFFQNFKYLPNLTTEEIAFHADTSSKLNIKNKHHQIQNTERKPEDQKPLTVANTGSKNTDRRMILQQYGFLSGEKLTMSDPKSAKNINTPAKEKMDYDNVKNSPRSLFTQLVAHESENKQITSINTDKHTQTMMESKTKPSVLRSPTNGKEKYSHPKLAGILKGVVDFNTDLINDQKTSAQRNLAARNLTGANSPPALKRHLDSFDSDIAGNPLTIVKKVNDRNDRTPTRNEAVQKMTAEYEIKQQEHLHKEKEKADKKRQEYLARYEHVDQGRRLYEPYLEEAAGFDPGFLITEEEARLRQQEKLEQEAEIYRGKEKERQERERQREEDKRKQRLENLNKHVDAGYKLGHRTKDTRCLDSEEVARLQQAKREAEFRKQQEKEREERQRLLKLQQEEHTDAGYKWYHDSKATNTAVREAKSLMTENPYKRETPQTALKTNHTEDEFPINPEEFVLEGQTFEEALEMQQQLLLAASKMKSQIKESKEEKQVQFDVHNRYNEKAAFTKPVEHSFVRREVPKTPVKSESFSKQSMKRSETVNQPDDKSGLKRSAFQENEYKSPHKLQKEQSTSKTPYKSTMANQVFNSVDAFQRNISKPCEPNKPPTADQKVSSITSKQQLETPCFEQPVNLKAQVTPNIKLAENDSCKANKNMTVKDIEKMMFSHTLETQNHKPSEQITAKEPKPQETKSSRQLVNTSVKELKNMLFQQKPHEDKSFKQLKNTVYKDKPTQNSNLKPLVNTVFKQLENLTVKELESTIFQKKPQENGKLKQQPSSSNLMPLVNTVFKQLENLTVKELESMIFQKKPQENGKLKQQPSSFVMRSSPRGPPTLLIRNSEHALQLAKQRHIDEIDKYGVLVTSQSVEEKVTPELTTQLPPRSALEELGKATGAIPKHRTSVAVLPADTTTLTTTNIPAKAEPEAEPVIDFQAEMRAVRQRMQEEYARGVSLRQLKENKTDHPQ